MSVYLIEGLPGNGKTLWLIDLMFADLKRGKHVYTNVDLNLSQFDHLTPMQFRIVRYMQHSKYFAPNRLISRIVLSLTHTVFPRDKPLSHYYHRIWSTDELDGLTNGNIYLDEANLYYNSRKFADLSEEDMRLLAQHRHYGLNIFGTVQAIKRVDLILRELSAYVFNIQKLITIRIPYTKISFGFFVIRTFRAATLLDSSGDGTEFHQVGWFRILFVDPTLFALYDTTQIVSKPTLIGRKEIIEYTYIETPQVKKIQTGIIKK